MLHPIHFPRVNKLKRCSNLFIDFIGSRFLIEACLLIVFFKEEVVASLDQERGLFEDEIRLYGLFCLVNKSTHAISFLLKGDKMISFLGFAMLTISRDEFDRSEDRLVENSASSCMHYMLLGLYYYKISSYSTGFQGALLNKI